MTVKLFDVPSSRSCFNLCDFGQVVFVVNTIAQYISKIPQGTFQGIRCPFFLRFLERCGFSFAVLNMTISDVLE